MYVLLCNHNNIMYHFHLQSSRYTPYDVIFGRKAVLPVDFNNQESYDPDEALRAFNKAPLPDPADVEARRTDLNVMAKQNIEKGQANKKSNT